MKYLDYLTTHEWEALPTAVQQTITRADYLERRNLALRMAENNASGLPPALAAAFVAAQAENMPRPQGAVEGLRRSAYRPWLFAAAGWLLFAAAILTMLFASPAEKVVYQVIAADIPEPLVVVQRDTVVETSVQTLIRYRNIHDTVYIERPALQVATVKDTVYLPVATTDRPVISGSRSLAGRQALTRLLFVTE